MCPKSLRKSVAEPRNEPRSPESQVSASTSSSRLFFHVAKADQDGKDGSVAKAQDWWSSDLMPSFQKCWAPPFSIDFSWKSLTKIKPSIHNILSLFPTYTSFLFNSHKYQFFKEGAGRSSEIYKACQPPGYFCWQLWMMHYFHTSSEQ